MQEVLVSKIFNYTSTPTKNVEGQFWFNPSTNVLSRFNGTEWKPITVSSDDVAVLTDGSKVSLTSYLNTQIAALAEGIDSKQDKLETYKEKQGDNNLDTQITSISSADSRDTGNITITTNANTPNPGDINLTTGSGYSYGGSINIISGSGSNGGNIKLQGGTNNAISDGTTGKIDIIGGNAGSDTAPTAQAGNINIKSGDNTSSGTIGANITLEGASSTQGGNIDITAGSATGENSASGRIKLNVPDKSGIVIDKDLIALNYKGDTNVPPSSNEWKFYIGGSGGISTGGDFSNSKTSNLYLGYGDYSTNINLGGSNSNATINICSAGSSNSNTINIGTAKTTNYINIGPSDSNSVYSTLTLNCETLSGKTFNTELTSTSDNNHIPTSKAVYDALTLKQDKLKYYSETSVYPSSAIISVNRIVLKGSVAEGAGTTVSDVYTHAEGSGTTAAGNYSHAEGVRTTASGFGSHAEGNFATASGLCSHAEGRHATASGDWSHAEGNRTIASSNYQHAQGKYNIEDANDKYADIIGNGSSSSAKSNAATVSWEGISWSQTDVRAGGTDQDAATHSLAAKQNATDNTLETTDKTIVGAINELKTVTDSMVVVSTDNAINIAPTTAQTGVLIASSKTNGGNVIITPKITNTGACYLSTSSTYSNLNPIYPDPTNNKYTYPNLGTVYLFVDNAGDSADIIIENFAG